MENNNEKLYVLDNGAWWEIAGYLSAVEVDGFYQITLGTMPLVLPTSSYEAKTILSVPKENAMFGPQVFWIVSEGNEDGDNGEFGVEINGVPYFYYKWEDASPSRMKYRRVRKNEFGNVIRRPT